MKRHAYKIIPIFLLSFLVQTIHADSVHLGNSAVSKEDVIQLLAPEDDFGTVKTRGIRLHGGQDKSIKPPSTTRALSMEIYFDFNSAKLTEKAKDQLVPVGEALRSNELSGLQFTLEGHTDAIGNDQYNMQLSEKRAQSVKAFFVSRYNLANDRIQAMGKGETELFDKNDPSNRVNRRVKIIAQ